MSSRQKLEKAGRLFSLETPKEAQSGPPKLARAPNTPFRFLGSGTVRKQDSVAFKPPSCVICYSSHR